MTAGLSASEGQASASVVLGALPFVFVAIFVGFIALVVVLVVRTARRERERQQRLWAYAMQCGWRPIPYGTSLPAAVEEAARSRRSKLVLGTRFEGFDMWLVWHHWTETSSSGDTTTTSTHDLTRYYLWPGRPCPEARVTRRTKIGASLMPVRGIGTGDAEFDRRFLVRGTPEPAAVAMLTPDLRQAMLAGYLPAWTVTGGTLVTAYNDPPRAETLQHRAGAAAQIARLLGA